MEWTRSETLALAAPACNICLGLGLRIGRSEATHPCNCVLRAIFRACFDRFRDCVSREKYMSRVTLDPLPGKERRGTWGRKDEEYSADFCLVSKRALTELEHRIFRYHFLLGADWKLCCHKLQMDRGNFFHAVYRIEQKLGRVFRELEPYALFPVNEYFHGPARRFQLPGRTPDPDPAALRARDVLARRRPDDRRMGGHVVKTRAALPHSNCFWNSANCCFKSSSSPRNCAISASRAPMRPGCGCRPNCVMSDAGEDAKTGGSPESRCA